ncbi:MAG: ATP/GTP-binding protein [Xanthomonadales bacterium]|nr:ATP/GTP-binding protein [Xanthomonadales bacterium]
MIHDHDVPKIVFAGPVGAGKTTAIRSVSDIAPVSTDVPMLEEPTGDKTTTTVALDFSTVELDDGTLLHLFGMPGQDHFEFMRAIVLEGALGVVLVLDGSGAGVAEDCRRWVASLRDHAPDVPGVVGITHTDQAPDFDLSRIRAVLRELGATLPVQTFDARESGETTQVLRALVAMALVDVGS